jgi:SAM-dependent methyltransferase
VTGWLRRRYEDRLTDRRARRPSGRKARKGFADPTMHYAHFGAILSLLELTPEDRYLEIGCGGGVLLRQALETAGSGAAIDHSRDMVRVARKQNPGVEIVHGDAASLPWPDESFTAAAMSSVLGFLPDPVAVFREVRRVLRPGGRLVVLGSPPEWKGTPAAPEPIASRLHFYTDEELERLAREAGFEEARVERIELAPWAPEEVREYFVGPGAPFLVARRH